MQKLASFVLLFACIQLSACLFFKPNALTNDRSKTQIICRANAIDARHADDYPRNQVLRCVDQSTIRVQTATFGLKFPKDCPMRSNETVTSRRCSETHDTQKILKNFCDGRHTCAINLKDLDLPDHCPEDAYIALSVEFKCTSSVMGFRPFAGNTGSIGPGGRGGFGRRRSLGGFAGGF